MFPGFSYTITIPYTADVSDTNKSITLTVKMEMSSSQYVPIYSLVNSNGDKVVGLKNLSEFQRDSIVSVLGEEKALSFGIYSRCMRIRENVSRELPTLSDVYSLDCSAAQSHIKVPKSVRILEAWCRGKPCTLDLSQCIDLEELDFSQRRDASSYDISHLTNLRKLDISHSTFCGTIPPSVEELDVSNTDVKDWMLKDLSKLKKLTVVNSKITVCPPSVEELHMNENSRITDYSKATLLTHVYYCGFDSNFVCPPTVTYLSLKWNDAEVDISLCENLKTLNLYGASAGHFAIPATLKELDIRNFKGTLDMTNASKNLTVIE